MNRRLTKAKLFDLVGKLRAKIPGIVFRTSIIVGFPGETEEEFQELCQDLESLALDHVGVFRYSKEEGTKAAEMDGQIHPRHQAPSLQGFDRDPSTPIVGAKREIRRPHRESPGRRPERRNRSSLQGRMPTQAQEIDGHVLINDLGNLVDAEGTPLVSAGDLIEVEISEALPHDLVGRATRLISKSRIRASRPAPRNGQPRMARRNEQVEA